MATDVERLVVQLEASLKQYEREFARAQKLTVSQLRKIERDAQASTSKIESTFGKMGGVIKGALAGAFAAVSVGSVTAAVKSAIDHMDELGKASQRIGIPVEALSKLEYAGELADVTLEDLEKSVGRLSKALVEIQAGKRNDAAAALQALGVSALDANGKLRPTEDILLDIADGFARYKDGASKTGIAMALFSRSGAAMIPLLNAGSQGLRENFEEAERFGRAIGGDAAKAAETFNDNLTRVKAAAQGFADKIVSGVLPGLADLSEEMVDALDTANAAEWVSASINQFFEDARNGATATKREIDLLIGAMSEMKSYADSYLDVITKQGTDTANLPRLDLGGGASVPNPEYRGYGDISMGHAQRYRPERTVPFGPVWPGPASKRDDREDAPALNLGTKRDDSAARRSVAEADRRAEAIRRVVEGLQLENTNLQTNSLQQKINTELKRAGVDAASAQGREIAKLVEANHNLSAAQELASMTMQEQYERMQELHSAQMALAEMGVDAFERIAFSGENATDVMIDLAKQIAQAAFQAAILGKGPLAGLFGGGSSGMGGGLIGSLLGGLFGGGGGGFGGFRASGGPVVPGKGYIVGEKGPEPFFPTTPGVVLPNAALRAGGGDTRVTIAVNLSGANGDAAVARIARQATIDGLREYERQRPLVDTERALRAG